MPRMVSLQRMIKETVCVAKEGDRETKKTGIDDILVDYCHDWKCFQELWNYLYGDLPLSPEPSISIRESCRIQPVLNYCCGQVGENLKHYLLSLTLFINYMLDRQGSKLLKKKRKPDQYKRRSLGRSTKLWHLPQRSGDPGTPSMIIWEMRNKAQKCKNNKNLHSWKTNQSQSRWDEKELDNFGGKHSKAFLGTGGPCERGLWRRKR